MFRLSFEAQLVQACLRWALLSFEVSHTIFAVSGWVQGQCWPKVTQPCVSSRQDEAACVPSFGMVIFSCTVSEHPRAFCPCGKTDPLLWRTQKKISRPWMKCFRGSHISCFRVGQQEGQHYSGCANSSEGVLGADRPGAPEGSDTPPPLPHFQVLISQMRSQPGRFQL